MPRGVPFPEGYVMDNAVSLANFSIIICGNEVE